MAFIIQINNERTNLDVHILQVVQILEGDEGLLELLQQRQNSKLQRTYSEELCHAEEYNSTKYLSDLDRQLEFVLGPL